MSADFVDFSNEEAIPTIADIHWLNGQENGGPPPTPDSWQPQNLADIPDEPPIRPTLGGLDLLYPGKRHVFSGPQESAKTLAAYAIALQVVREGSKVVLIDFEMGPWDAKTRLRELGATGEEMSRVLYVEPDTGATEAATDALLAERPALVVVDAAAGAYVVEGYDDNSRKDAETWARKWTTPFWRQGIATLVIDHVVKNAELRGNYAIGSGRKIEGVDVHLGFSVVTPIKRGSTGVYKVTTHKDRGGFLKRGKLADFELSSDPETHAITWAFKPATEVDEEHPFRPTIKMEQISHWLEKHSEPVPLGQIEDGVGGNRDAFRQAIQVLVDEGFVEETRGARNARLMELVRAYRSVADDLAPTSPDLAQIGGLSDLASSPNPLRGGRGAGEDEEAWARSARPTLEDDDGIPF